MLRSNSTRSGESAESVLTGRSWISSDEADCFAHSRYSVSCEADWLMAVVPSRADRPTKLPPSTNTSRLYDLPVSLSVSQSRIPPTAAAAAACQFTPCYVVPHTPLLHSYIYCRPTDGRALSCFRTLPKQSLTELRNVIFVY